MIEFRVRGLPVSQGNAKAFVVKGRAVLATGVKSSSPLGAWRDAVGTECRVAMPFLEPCLTTPVGVELGFWMPRPKAHWHTPLHGAGIRETAPRWHTTKPDIDKLTRAVLDAITAVAIRDDSQVVELVVRKRYETATEPIGAFVRIWEVRP